MLYGKYVIEGATDLEKTVKQLGLDDVEAFLPIEEHATLHHLMTARSGICMTTRDLIFDSIGYRTLRARSVTKNRPVSVTVIPGDRLVSFLEVTPEGVPIITSILRTPRPLDHRLNNTYYVVRSYQLLISEQGDKSEKLDGVCTPRQ